jgi:hypothetical protein
MSNAPAQTDLGIFMRGDGFAMTFILGNEWTSAMADEVWFTLRDAIPESDVVTDDDAVAQATMTGDGINFDVGGTVGTVTIGKDATRSWPAKKLHWDVQLGVDGDPKSPYTVGRGTLTVAGDVTRSS